MFPRLLFFLQLFWSLLYPSRLFTPLVRTVKYLHPLLYNFPNHTYNPNRYIFTLHLFCKYCRLQLDAPLHIRFTCTGKSGANNIWLVGTGIRVAIFLIKVRNIFLIKDKNTNGSNNGEGEGRGTGVVVCPSPLYVRNCIVHTGCILSHSEHPHIYIYVCIYIL